MDVLTLVITGLSIPLLVCTIFGNFLVGVVVKRNKQWQNVNTCLISQLAWSDFGFGIVTFFEILSVSQKFVTLEMSSFQFVINGLASVYFLAALALERYFAILKPFVHMRRARKSLMWKVLLVIWISVGVLGTTGIIIDGKVSQSALESAMANVTSHSPLANVTEGTPTLLETLSTAYIFVLLVFGFVLPSAVMIFCYSRVIYHVWFNTEENRATNHALFKSRRKLTKLFIILTITFLFTWTPTFGRPIVTRFESGENARKYQLFSMLLALLGAAANPVIYTFHCPRFRQEGVKLLTCCCCKRKRQVNSNRIFSADSFSLKETKKTKTIGEPVAISFRAT